MELTQREIRLQFLNSIMKENKVSLKSIYDCMDNKKNDIDTMDQIFDSDDELSVRKRLVLLSLISRDITQENLNYYLNVEHISKEFIGNGIKDYKALIISSLMFNNLFFISSCNWCGLIQRDVKRLKKIQERIGIRFDQYSEYLEMEQKIAILAEKYSFKSITDSGVTNIPLEIHTPDMRNELNIIDAAYNKELKEIIFKCQRKTQEKSFILWIINKNNQCEPFPICLSQDNAGNFCGQLEEELPELCKFILDELNIQKPDQNVEKIYIQLTVFKIEQDRIIYHDPKQKDIEVSKGAGTGYEQFLWIPVEHNGIRGILSFRGNDQHEVQLVFIFDEFQKIIPFELEVYFTTKRDDEKHKIPVPAKYNESDEKLNSTFIKSDPKDGVGIDWSGGIKGDYTIAVMPLNIP